VNIRNVRNIFKNIFKTRNSILIYVLLEHQKVFFEFSDFLHL